ncbi:MAG: sugar phosphate isomerase/epimerase [Rhodobacteraceae bacterium]|jgi:sugar phosphate isomerase/epimerase|nr:sugar phosphate isomerase/epimerase [Paracoccaceae bacterium]MBL4556526.1 sugar phosphate isomerase/epimerase [Paracoccaceae bacterium]MBL4557858.1 sugar phosphate isomerase/epimerase [Paracoccaceae bacterium]HBG99002.1 sugar phosphate isomerase [Paracoccaceae bacterium]
MTDLPLKVGAALMIEDLPTYRRWLIEGQRDLEVQDFLEPDLLLGDWRATVAKARRLLDGFDGRLGIHGPFYDLPLDIRDPELAPILSRRMVTAVAAAAALGATQMVVHSPYKTWDWYNFGDNPRVGNAPSAAEETIARVQANLAKAVALAETHGVTLVIENIEDIAPGWRRALAASFGSDRVQLSIDTGHAHYAHAATGAPPVDYFVSDAGPMLAHVHLQDADGFADRHWPPGRGTVNWHAVFRAIAALPQRPHLVLELRHAADIPAAMAFLEREGLAC